MCGQKGKAEVSEIKRKFLSLTTPYTHTKIKNIFIKEKANNDNYIPEKLLVRRKEPSK